MVGSHEKTPSELQEMLEHGRIKAVIFDFDGTLLDINEPLHKSVTEVLQKYGIAADRERTMIEIGSILDTVQALPIPKIILESYDIFQAVTAMKDHRLLKKIRVATSIFSRYQKMAEDAKLCQGVEPLLAALASRAKLYIVSHNLTKRVENNLAKFGLNKYFSGVFGADVLPALKPDPAAVRFATNQLGSHKPEEIVVIGDMPTDIEAGQKAGYWTVAVATGFIPHSHLQVSRPDILVHNLFEFMDIVHIRSAPVITVAQKHDKRDKRA